VAHVGFVEDGQPFVIPLGYQFSAETPDRIYFHGSLASRAMRHMASGAPVCVTVTLLNGLVYSRTALYHSMNYRSAVCFGRGKRVTDSAVQRAVYERMVRRYFPGRTEGRDYSAPTAAEEPETTPSAGVHAGGAAGGEVAGCEGDGAEQAATATNVGRSVGFTSNSRLAMERVASQAQAKPSTMPARARCEPWLRTRRITLPAALPAPCGCRSPRSAVPPSKSSARTNPPAIRRERCRRRQLAGMSRSGAPR
jgi:nitroimidazol reductase NimA-like FMN-containing flavoprotein (pyridoxamine 5'-phosphate oxidase superfamily)